ncbi:hypothetical protein [Streptomyces sp. NPDC002067]
MREDEAPANDLTEVIREAKSAGIQADSFRNAEHPENPGRDVATALLLVRGRHHPVHRDRRDRAACEVHPGQVSGVTHPADGAELRLGTAAHTPRLAPEAPLRTTARPTVAHARAQPRPASLAA